MLVGDLSKSEQPRTLEIGSGFYRGRTAGSIGSRETYLVGYTFTWTIRTT